MDLTTAALWLNSFFASFDHAILEALHELAVATDSAFTPVFITISMLAEKGIVLILIGLILTLIKKTRRMGVCILIAICLGALVTSGLLKDLIERLRPYEMQDTYYSWWQFAQSQIETDPSFPSGHTTATMAFATAIFLTSKNKKVSWLIFLAPLIMGISRIYLVVHYPSDVLGGILVGGIAGVAAYFITKALFHFFGRRKHADRSCVDKGRS